MFKLIRKRKLENLECKYLYTLTQLTMRDNENAELRMRLIGNAAGEPRIQEHDIARDNIK